MRLEAGASYEAIATALGCPTPNAARVTVGRALHRLAEHLAAPRRPAAAPPPASLAARRPRPPADRDVTFSVALLASISRDLPLPSR